MKKKFIAPRITSTIIEEEVMVAASKCPHHNTGWAQTPNAPYTDVDKTGDLNEKQETKKLFQTSDNPWIKKWQYMGCYRYRSFGNGIPSVEYLGQIINDGEHYHFYKDSDGNILAKECESPL